MINTHTHNYLLWSTPQAHRVYTTITTRTHHEQTTTTSTPRVHHKRTTSTSTSTPGKQCDHITAPRAHEREHHERITSAQNPPPQTLEDSFSTVSKPIKRFEFNNIILVGKRWTRSTCVLLHNRSHSTDHKILFYFLELKSFCKVTDFLTHFWTKRWWKFAGFSTDFFSQRGLAVWRHRKYEENTEEIDIPESGSFRPSSADDNELRLWSMDIHMEKH